MESISKICDIDRAKSLVLGFATTKFIPGADSITLSKGSTLQIENSRDSSLYIVHSGKLCFSTQHFQQGHIINQDLYQKPLLVQSDCRVLKLPSPLGSTYLEQLDKYYEEFNCILSSLFGVDINITDNNCIQLVRMSEGTILTEYNKMNRVFFVLIEGSCSVGRLFHLDQKQEISFDLSSAKSYYLLGEEALFSEAYSQKVICTSGCYLLRISVQKFFKHLPLNLYSELRVQHRTKNQRMSQSHTYHKSKCKGKLMNAQDIIEYYQRSNEINNRMIWKLNRVRTHNTQILEKFCEKNQSISSDYMKYFIESTEEKVRFELISKGYRKGESVEKVTHSMSKDQLKRLLRKKVINELKTQGKSKKSLQKVMGVKSKCQQKRCA